MTSRSTLRVLVGSLSFFVCLSLGVFVTVLVRNNAVRELPREEVYEAIHRDMLAVQWSLAGWTISFVISIIVAVVTSSITCGFNRR